MDPAWILLQTPIFRDLSVRDVEELLPDLRERSYARGETVWIEGDRAEVFVVLAEGQLQGVPGEPQWARGDPERVPGGSRSPARWDCSTRSASGG
jgi:hypothetical protein